MNIACGWGVNRLLLTYTTILSIIHHSFKPSNHSNLNFTLYAVPSTQQSIDKMHIHSIVNHVLRGSLLFSQLRMIWGRLAACIAVSEENERVVVQVAALHCSSCDFVALHCGAIAEPRSSCDARNIVSFLWPFIDNAERAQTLNLEACRRVALNAKSWG